MNDNRSAAALVAEGYRQGYEAARPRFDRDEARAAVAEFLAEPITRARIEELLDRLEAHL